MNIKKRWRLENVCIVFFCKIEISSSIFSTYLERVLGIKQIKRKGNYSFWSISVSQ